MKRLDINVITQVSIWDWFARIAPFLFVIISTIFVYGDIAEAKFVFLAGFVLFFITCIVWWYWTMAVIVKMYNVLKSAEENLNVVLDEVKKVKNDISTGSHR